MKLSVEQRLLNRTTEDLHVSSPWVDTPCWVCIRSQIRVNGRREYASRIAFWVWITSIPYGLLVLHFCDNPRCVNPEHLWLGTHADNSEDMVYKERQNSARGDANGSRTHPEKLAIGEANGSAKITEQDVLDIRSYKEQGCRQCDVVAFMKLTRNIVGKIWRGSRWKHVK